MENEIKSFNQEPQQTSRALREFMEYVRFHLNADLCSLKLGEKSIFIDKAETLRKTISILKEKVANTGKFSETSFPTQLKVQVEAAYAEIEECIKGYKEDDTLVPITSIQANLDKTLGMFSVFVSSDSKSSTLGVQVYDRNILQGESKSCDAYITQLAYALDPNSFGTTSLNSIRVLNATETRTEILFIQGDYARKSATERGNNVVAKALIFDKESATYCIKDISDLGYKPVIDELTKVY